MVHKLEIMLKGNLKAIKNGDGIVTISGNCVFTGKSYSVTVNIDEYVMWTNGQLIYCAMPDISLYDREFLISGISPMFLW